MYKLNLKKKKKHDLPGKKLQEEQPMRQQRKRQILLPHRLLEILPVPHQDVQLQTLHASLLVIHMYTEVQA